MSKSGRKKTADVLVHEIGDSAYSMSVFDAVLRNVDVSVH